MLVRLGLIRITTLRPTLCRDNTALCPTDADFTPLFYHVQAHFISRIAPCEMYRYAICGCIFIKSLFFAVVIVINF